MAVNLYTWAKHNTDGCSY